MNIIHTYLPKTKKRKPTAKQRELRASWEAMLKKYETKTVSKTVARTVASPVVTKNVIRETPYYPSLNSGLGTATMKPSKVYTGTMVKGIATMHKSNAVPVFSNEEAVEISKMRRG
jgi:hypothetical protein